MGKLLRFVMSLTYSTYALAIIKALNLKRQHQTNIVALALTAVGRIVSEFQIFMETSNITVAKTVILLRGTTN